VFFIFFSCKRSVAFALPSPSPDWIGDGSASDLHVHSSTYAIY